MLLLIDNYDSFTYNLARYFVELAIEVKVVRHDEITIEEIERLAPQYIVISPGPGNPDQSGISLQVIDAFKDRIPLLGVCLGHQCIAQYFGAKIIHAPQVCHGKVSFIHHQQQGIFAECPQPFQATRYHSLVVDWQSLPPELIITAWTEDEHRQKECIMGLKHQQYPIYGVQFHPESVLSVCGHQLLKNFLA